MESPLMKYQARAGTSDSEKMEWKMAAWISLRCALSPEDMWISTNVDGVGEFADVVFRQGDQIFMLQLKHDDESRSLSEEDFSASQGDYSLLKYVADSAKVNQTFADPLLDTTGMLDYLGAFNKINFVLLLNRSVQPCKFLEKGGKDEVLTFLDSSSRDNSLKNQTKDLPDTTNNFYLLPNQTPAKNLDLQITQEIVKIAEQLELKEFDPTRITDDFIKFVELWAKGLLGGHYCLTKRDILTKLSELFFQQFELKLDQERFFTGTNDQQALWNRLIQNKSVTVVDFDEDTLKFLIECVGAKLNGISKVSKEFWADELSDIEKECFFRNLKPYMLKRGNCGKVTLLDAYKCLWMANQVPLLLEISKVCQYHDIISISKLTNYSQKVIIVNKSENSPLPTNTEKKTYHFESILDLPEELRREILNQRVTIQTRPVILARLAYEHMYRHIKCREIIAILLGNFNFGNNLNPLPPNFIRRNVSKTLLRPEVLEEVPDDIFLIEDNSYVYCLGMLSVKYVKVDADWDGSTHSHVIIVPKGFIEKAARKLESSSKPIHCLAIHDSNHLEWKTSHGSITNLKRFRVELQEVTESDVKGKFSRPVNIVSAAPGMGKSTLMDYVALQAPTNEWVLKVDLNAHQEYYQRIKFDTLAEASEHILYFKNSLPKQSNAEPTDSIFRNRFYNNHVIVLLDGFEEVPSRYQETVTKIAKSILQKGYRVWITTAPHLKSHLEDELDTFSITLAPFTQEEQRRLLTEYLGADCDPILQNEYAEQLLEAAQRNLNDFAGTPLLLKLLGEVFEGDCKKCLLSNGAIKFDTGFDLVYLYEHYVRKKSEGNFCEMSREHHSWLALILSFGLQGDLLADIKKELEDCYGCRSVSDLLIVDQNLRFVHRTFWEFLAAQWLFKNFNGPNERSRKIARILIDDRFSEEHAFLFNMFDRLLCKDCTLHLAVINQDPDEALRIMESDSDQITTIDACGRSILHLTALYGVAFPRMSSTFDSQRFLHNEEYNSDGILGVLEKVPKELIFKTETDSLGYSPLDYALASRALHVADKICAKCMASPVTSINIETSWKRDYLGYCAILDYESLINVLLEYFVFSDVLLWKTQYPYQCEKLDYLSSISNYSRYFREVFADIPTSTSYPSDIANYRIKTESKYDILTWTNSCYYTLCHAIVFDSKSDMDIQLKRPEINNSYGLTPLHCVVFCKNTEILDTLPSARAHANRRDVLGNTPLHLAVTCRGLNLCPNNKACEETHRKIITRLLSLGSAINLQNDQGNTATHIALSAQNVNLAKLLISNNLDASLVNHQGKNLIHLAAEHGNHEMLNGMVLQEADLNKRDNYGRSPLFYAARRADTDLVELLVCKGTDISIRDTDGLNAHDVCLIQRSYKLSDLLLHLGYYRDVGTPKPIDHSESGPNKEAEVNKQDADGNTPLFYAVRDKHPKTVKLVENKKGQTVLHLAAKTASLYILREILLQSVDIDKQDHDGWSPLFHAVDAKSHTSTWLVYKGANVNLKDKRGQTVLHLAARRSSFAVLIHVLRESTESIDKVDDEGRTPLSHVVRNGDLRNVELLLRFGAKVTVDEKGQSLLHFVARNSSASMLVEIMNRTKDIDQQDRDGWSALLHAVDGSQTQNASWLLSKGANSNLANKRGETALHLAAKHGSNHILNDLLKKSVQIDRRTQDGWTPLFFAVFHNNKANVKLLITHGSDTNIVDNNSKTVFDIARKKGFKDILELLVENKTPTKCTIF